MPDFHIRPREAWLDPAGPPWDHTINGKGQFYVCPPFRGWDEVDTVVIHYPGADWADMDINNDNRVDEFDSIDILRSGHRMYLMGSRGYSLGYGFEIGQVGDIWEVRGTEYANAANLGDAAHGTNPPPWNNSTVSIMLIVDEADEANDIQVSAVNWLLDELTRQSGKQLNLTWHRAGQSTACPGDGIVNQLNAGIIGFGKSQPDVPEVPDNMAKRTLFVPTDCDAQFLGWADDDGNALELFWVNKAVADAHRAVGVVVRDQLSFGGFRNCILLGPIPVGDTRHQWDGSEFFRVVS